jgi:uncharacterized protein
VLSVDTKAKRIALSIKQLSAPSPRPAAKPEKAVARPEKPTAGPQPTINEKLAALSAKWKVR